MILVEIIVEFVVTVLFQGLILGTARRIKRGWNFLGRKIRKLPPPEPDAIEQLTRNDLYKSILTTDDINPRVKAGMMGAVLEILDKQTVLAEFMDSNGKQIEYEGEIVFEVKVDQYKRV